MNFGHHLADFVKMSLPECNQTVIKEALDIFDGTDSEVCPPISVCKTTKFSLSLQEFDRPKGKDT